MKKGILKNYGILVITFLIVIPVLIIQLSGKRFKQGAEIIALPALTLRNTITGSQLMALEKGSMLVSQRSTFPVTNPELDILVFDTETIASPYLLQSLRRAERPLVITDSDPGLEARVWMILSQLGVKDLYIYLEDETDILLKHEFRPDTSVSK